MAGISTAGLVAGGVAVAAGVGVSAATGDDSSSSDEDTTAPEAPVLDETKGNILTGSSEPGATIEVTNAAGDNVGSAVADADGNFSVELSPAQAAGTELTATATDAAGNVSEASTAVTVPQGADTTAPNTPSIAAATDDVEAITGALEDGDSTNDTTPTLGGTAEVGSTVTVTLDGDVIGTTTADSNGAWSFTPNTELGDGEHVFSVTATDTAGNESAPSGEFTLSIDTEAPVAPALNDSDGTTASGTAEVGSDIEISNSNGDSVGTGIAEDDGTFSIELDPAQQDGEALTATATDPSGNTSSSSTPATVDTNTDSTAPNTPTIAAATDDVEAITGALEDGDSTNDATPTLTGSAEAGSTVTITHNGEVVDSVTADVNGSWSYTPSAELIDGDHVFSVTATDEAGNVSAPSGELTLTVDTSAPDAPVLSETDGETANGSTVNGSAEAGGTVEVTNGDGDLLGSGTVADDGTFSITLSPKQEAGAELTATVTDAAGNESPVSDTLVVPETADVTAPNTPTIASATDDVEAVTGTLASGDSTNDATPTLTGSAEAGSTVTITHNGEEIGTTTADTNGTWSFTPETDFADGEHVFSVTATDDADNESAPSGEFTLTVDTTAPDAPVLSETDGTTVAGTGEAGTTIEITNTAGDILGSAVVDAEGNFSVELSPEQEAGSTLTATATDAAGNESAASTALDVPEDADVTPPNTPTIASATDDVEAVTGALASGDSTNDATPTLTGSAEAGSTVTITHNGEVVDSVTADTNGAWSYTPSTDLTDGEHVFSVTATDAASNESAPSGEFSLTVDTTAPDAPVLSETDGETANGSTVNGSAEAGGAVEVTNGDGDLLGTGTVADDGTFSITLSPKQEAGAELTATVTDAAGNESPASDTLVVPEAADVTAPNTPTITSATDDVEAVTGALASGDSTNDATPTLTGSAEAGSTVTVTQNGEVIDSVTADANGSWSYTPSTDLTEGDHVFSVTATDAAGNESAASGEFTLTVDTAAPDAPVLTETDGTTVAGTGEAGTTVEITNANDDVVGTAVVDAEGNFSVELSPEQEAGSTLTATATDGAGNESAASAALDVPEDADVTAPNTPTITSATDDVAADTGALASGDSTNDAAPTLIGSAEANSTVTITHNGEEIATVTADANGAWSYTPSTDLTDGDHVFSVTATDAAGNESPASGEFTLTVDTTAPDAPVLTETDGTTVAGTGEAGTTVEITNANDDVVGTAVVDAEGNFSVELSPEQEAGSTLTATATDGAGNESAASAALDVPEDADVTAPNTPTITSATDDVAADTGALASGDSTNDAAPTLIGSAEANSTVTITHNGEEIATVTADANGAWSYTPSTDLTDGDHVFSVTATDAAGNESPASGEFTLTVDTTAPDAPVLSETDGTTVAGTGEAGTTVEITNANDDVVGTAVVDAEGNFSVELSPEQEAGSTLTATATDGAGNESAASAALDVPEDADVTAPNTPTITSATDDVAADTGALASGDSTNDAAPTLIGSAEANSTVTITHNGEEIATVTADANGAWSYTPSTDLTDGDHVFSVTATDAAGNESPASGEFTLTVDTTAPDAPVLSETDGTTVAGTGEAGTTVEITNANDDVVGTAVVDAEGNFSVELSPEQEAGSTLTATATDAAGNESAASAALDVPEDADVTAPNTPTITSATDDVAADTGALASGDSTNDAAPTLIGSAEANSTVTITHNGEEIATVTADANGAWSYTPSTDLTDGDHVFSVTATDAAGNESPASGEFTLTVDTTAPDAPVLSETDGTTVAGTGEAGTTVEITNANDDVVGTAVVDAEGNFSVELSPEQEAGSTLTATATDAAGNESAASAALDVPEDADVTAPNTPTITSATDDVAADTGALASGDSTNDAAPTLTGSAEANSTVTITHNGEEIATATADANGAWSYTPSTDLTEGNHVFSVTATDAAGNESAPSGEFTLTVDTTVPTSPALALSSDTGMDDDGITSNGEVTVSGLEADATWEYSLDGGSNWIDGTGTTFTLDEGVYADDDVQIRQTDVAGNVSDAVNLGDVTVDATIAAPSLALSEDTNVTDDGITSNGEVTVSDLEAGATWEYTTDGGSNWIDGTGTTFTLDEGVYADGVVQIRQTDVAGNVSDAVNLGDVTVDTTVPTGSIAFVDGDDGLLNLADISAVDLTGSIEAGLDSSNIVITITDSADPANEITVATTDITVDGAGNLSVTGLDLSTATSGLTEGALTVSMTVTDVAGNTFETDGTTTSDLSVPDAPSLALTTDTNITDDGITSNGEVTVSDLEADAIWEYTTNGGTTWIAGTGTTFTLAEGSYADGSVQIRQTDVAGNFSDAVNLGDVTVDATIAAPSLALSEDTNITDDGITSNGEVTVSDLEADATWEYSLDGGSNWIDGTGTTFTLDEGVYADGDVQIRQTDVAGNISDAVNLGAVTVDATIAAPSLTLGEDTNVTDDGITSNGEVTVSDLEAGATWEYTTDGGSNWIDGTGTTFTLDEGVYADGVVQIRQTDVAGNVSDAVNLGDVTVDTTVPTGSIAFVDGDDGLLNLADISAVDLTGSIEAGLDSSNIVITITDSADPANEITVATTDITVDGAGNLSVTGLDLSTATSGLTEGALTVSMTVTDVAGNTFETDGTTTSDLTVPEVPSLALSEDTNVTDDGITSNGEVIVSDLEADASWEYSTDGGSNWVDGTGTTFTLAEGSYADGAVQIRQIDVAGNVSDAVNLGAVTVDATDPTGSIAFVDGGDGLLNLADISAVDLTGSIEAGLDSSNVVITITDSADPANKITVATTDITVDGAGNLSVTGLDLSTATSGLTEGALTVSMTVTDVAGNTFETDGTTTSDLTVPEVPSLALSEDTNVTDDGITSNGEVTVSDLEADASWEYSLDGGSNWIDGTGTTFTLDEGVYADGDVQIRQTDVAGNVSDAMNLGAVTVDATIAAPSLTLSEDTNVTDDGITSNGEVTVSDLEAGATWEYTTDGGSNWIDGTGTTFTLDEGVYADGVVQIRQTDVAGNVSDAVNLGDVTVDTTVPTGSIAFVDGDDGLLNLADISAVDLTGSIEAGLDSSNIVITITDSADPANEITVATTDITVDGAGNLSVTGLDLSTATSGLTEGALTVSMTVTDVAGNTFETDGTTTSDLTVPEVPSLALSEDTNVTDDGITSNGEVIVSDLEADASWEYSTDGGSNWVDGTGTTFTLAEGSYADGAVQIRQIDVAGNVSDAVNLGAVTVDATDPTGSIAFVDGGDGLLNLADISAVDLTGSIEAGLDSSNVVITITDSADPANKITVATTDITVDGAGNLSVTGLDLSTATSGLTEGALTVSMTVTDVAGNTFETDGTTTSDLTVPEVPSLALSEDTNVTDDGITSNGEVTVSDLEADASWEYSLDGGSNWIDGTGTTFTLDEGVYADGDVQIRQTDVAGNVSDAMNLGAVTVDATIAAPSLTLSEDTNVTDDGITSNGEVTVSDLEAGATWEYTTDGGSNWIDGTGTTFTLDEGVYADGVVQIRQTDVAGNVSDAVNLGDVTVDTTVPTGSIAFVDGDDGLLNLADISAVDLTGSIEAGLDSSNIVITITDSADPANEITVATTDITVDGAGNLSVTGLDLSTATSGLTEGALTVSMTVTDVAGNTFETDGTTTSDLTVPEVPSLALSEDTNVTDDGITSNGEVIVSDLEADASWEYSTDGGSNWVDGTGTTFTLAEGSYADGAVQIRQIDVAGNVSDAVNLGAVTVDATDPTGSIAFVDGGDGLLNLADISAVDLTGSIEAGLDSSNVVITITDSADPANKITVATTDITVDGAGNLSVTGLDLSTATSGLTEGALTVSMTVTDVAGNTFETDGTTTSDLTVPEVPSLALSEDTNVTDDGITSNGEVTVSDLEADASWEYSLDGGSNWIDGTGTTFTLDEGVYADGDVQIRQTDVAGNVSDAMNLGAVTVDATIAAPSLTLSEDTNVTDDGITSNGEVTVSDLEAGATWEYTTDGGSNWIDGTGTTFTLDEGVYADGVVQIRQTDVAGNVSDAVNLGDVTVDTTVPTGSIAFVDGDDGLLNLADISAVDLTGSIEAGLDSSNIVITITDSADPANEITVATTDITVDGAGNLSVTGLDLSTATSGLTEGALTVSMTVTDVAGNTFETDGTTTSDLTVPEVPSLALSEDTNVTDDGITSNGEVIVSDLEADASWEYSTDGGSNWVDGTGTTFTLAEGSYADGAVQIRQIDVAGNVSDAVNLGAVTVDATDPTGSIAFVDGGDGLLNLADISAVDLTGSIEAGLDSSNVVITITDSADPANKITVATTDITVDGAGNLSVTGLDLSTATSGLTEGALTVSMTVTDVAGNTFETDGTTTSDLTVPEVPSLALSEDTNITDDGITSNGEVTVSGLEVDATWEYTTNGGTTWIAGTGTTFTLAEGSYADGAVQIRQIDVAGNVSTEVSLGAVTIDTTAPLESVINFTDADGDDLNAAEATDVTFEGTVEAGLTSSNLTIVITDTDNGSVTVPTENITVSAVGEVTVSGVDLTGLAEGLLTVTMTVTDDAGNENVAAVTDTATKLSDDFLDLGNANRLTISEALIASVAGAVASSQTFADTSGEATLSLSSTESLTSNGQALDWVVTDEGRTLTLASDVDNAAATAVMVVSVTEDGSEVVYSAELLGNIDQANAESSTVDVLVTLTDGTSSTSSTLNIDITDDVPTIAASTVVETLSSNTDYTGSIFDGEDDFGFGADVANGQVQSFAFKGLTFTVSDDGTYADVTGTSTEIGLEAGDTVSIVDGILAVETLSGESFSLNIDSGDYGYSHQGQFSATEEDNTRPIANVSNTDDVLGLVGVNLLDIVDLSNDQLYSAYDAEGNLESITLSTANLYTTIEELLGTVSGVLDSIINPVDPITGLPLLSIISLEDLINGIIAESQWSFSSALESELGLNVTPTEVGNILTLTITDSDGGTISNIEASEILANVEFTIELTGVVGGVIDTLNTLGVLNANNILNSILETSVITASDSLSAESNTAADATVLTADILAEGYTSPVVEGTNGDDSSIDASVPGSNLYGYAGNDTLNGGSGSNILRGGSGNDELNGGGATDLLIGGADDDTLDGGDGVDVLRWESGDEGTVAAAATDTVLNFDNGGVGSGDILDLRDILNGAYYVDSATNNLASYISAEYISASDTTILYINTEGGFTTDPAASANQVINIDGLDLTEGGTLTSSEVIDSLISGEQLLVGTEVNESDVSVTVVDGDGDTATGEITFVGEESLDAVTNTAPIVTLQDSELLGLVGLEALNLIDLSNNKVFVADPDNNLREVVINYAAIADVSALSGLLTDPEFTWNDELATSLGLSVSTSSGGLIGTVLTTAELTITAIDGGDIDNLALNQFLATIEFNDGGASELNLVDVDLLDAYSITATDAYDASTTDTISSLAGVDLLDSNEPLFSGVNDENTFIGEQLIDDSIDISANLEGGTIFGLSGNDSLIGSSFDDVIRGGEGDDSLVGNAGNDLLIGDSGSNTFDGGDGDDLIVISNLDFTIEGGAGSDTVSFDGTGKGIDLVALSAQAEPSVMTNIEVLDISASSETGTSLKIDADTVLNLTDGDNELYIDGDEGDSVEAAGATSSATTTEFNGTTYDTYQLGEATLYIDQDVTVNTSNG
ncbi:Ig-like domain-containing protein [Cobetia sp. D5]|uniref:Ig-like domain-containing protein n=1 Tax=Cobetia sp. D5 TaxID=3105867 RepID=UPI002D7775EE|nr:Ig-like domain-containing protein [Cobetia sp. D5]